MRVTPVHISLTLDGAPGEPVIWPLRYLRRWVTRERSIMYPNRHPYFVGSNQPNPSSYGRDRNEFNFEAGRKASTGPGVYAFETIEFNHLFQLVDS